ncbi:MAG: hypothetical protein H7Z76_14735 [Methylotenera sp.]|nr:hypothetical protein [Flavobacterium sp.]
MKTILLFFAPILIAALLFTACKKESVTTSPVTPCATVTIHDTIYIQPPTRLQTLTAKIWELDEVNRNNSGFNTRYIKGGSNTTGTSYNLFRLKFNVDGTGTYTDETGVSHTLNWSFTGTNQRSITLNVGPPFATSFVWYTVELAGNYMHQTSVSGSSSLLSSRFVQIP